VFLDEATVVSAGDDGRLQWIDHAAGRILATVRAHDGKIYDLDRHGDRLLTASSDRTIRLWSLRDRSLARTYVGHQRPVIAVRWHAGGDRFVSGDGDTVESGGSEGHACVWRVDRDTCQDWLIGHRDDVRAAQFIDDARVLTASFDGTVRIWTPASSTPDADPATELARRAPACLDAQERRAYLGEPAPAAAERATACRQTAP
jgi:WD40 repeat protein